METDRTNSRCATLQEMGKDDGRVVYKIEIVDGKNTHKVYVNAMADKVHEIK